jgi:hypothetical protein
VASTPACERFDHLLYRLIDENNGVFIGERHDHSSVRESLMHLLPAIKSRGVETLSLEIPQQMVDDIIKAGSADAWIAAQSEGELNKFTGGKDVAVSIAQLVHKAHKYEITVLGHECGMEPNVEAAAKAHEELTKKAPKIARIFDRINEEVNKPDFKGSLSEALQKELTEEIAAMRADPARSEEITALNNFIAVTSPARNVQEDGMNERNKRSVDYLKKNAKGKVLALGGTLHSGNYKPDDSMKVMVHTIGETLLVQMEQNPRGIVVEKEYAGLDVLMNYPAIDYNHVDAAGSVGLTKKTDGKFNNYEVVLPPTVKEMKITSWPPPKGVPTIEELRPPVFNFPIFPFPGMGLPPAPTAPDAPPPPVDLPECPPDTPRAIAPRPRCITGSGR